MDYYKYAVTADKATQEIVLAMLGELVAFDSFVETKEEITAFVPKADWSVSFDQDVADILKRLGLQHKKELIPHQNWNEKWESNFEPITIPGKCLVRALFHPPQPEYPHEILIQPQMAFGTGHHATTYLVIDRMFSIDFSGKKVLDYGCGTGILAILASKLGAKSIDAIDNDPLSTENTAENLITNEIANVNCLLGTIEKIEGKNYDIILANINRNVLLISCKPLFQQLSKNGILLVSGLLEQDEDIISTTYEKEGFSKQQVQRKSGWICIEFRKE